ncbi:hypothetical protein AAL_06268 [Moelleriella libera RCEF 2490]|uniref:Phosphotransferase family protein n=1 Tax=Moelleriella libera RCEF 2490 TaxID=1081109 RepID=A0A167Z266_9HYPO|nr:hypothetical protein AAL_06268 [Moelleriella libera RCEF 2490]
MTQKPRHVFMPRDDLAREQSDATVNAWEKAQLTSDSFRAVAKFIKKHRPGKAVELHKPIRGGYNVYYRPEYDDGSSIALRIPIDRHLPLRSRRLNPLGVGPLIITEYIEHTSTMSDAMADPSLAPRKDDALDPNIEEEKLEFIYTQLANVML